MERQRPVDGRQSGGGRRSARSIAVVVAMVGALLLLSACAPGGDTYTDDKAGFFSGVWHGWIAPLSIILHFFDDKFRVYETNNTGIWYDIGFYIAIISGFGSISFTRGRDDGRKRRSNSKSD